MISKQSLKNSRTPSNIPRFRLSEQKAQADQANNLSHRGFLLKIVALASRYEMLQISPYMAKLMPKHDF